jgi:hypothetical protein
VQLASKLEAEGVRPLPSILHSPLRLTLRNALAGGNLLEKLTTPNGLPMLAEHFQANIPEFLITSMPVVQHFEPLSALTIAAPASAQKTGRKNTAPCISSLLFIDLTGHAYWQHSFRSFLRSMARGRPYERTHSHDTGKKDHLRMNNRLSDK